MKQKEVENNKLIIECLEDAKKFKEMNIKEGFEYMANIQQEISRQLSNTAENVKKTLDQNKSLVPILNNAIIMVQRDFVNVMEEETKKREDGYNLCFIIGGNKQLTKLIKILATQLPIEMK